MSLPLAAQTSHLLPRRDPPQPSPCRHQVRLLQRNQPLPYPARGRQPAATWRSQPFPRASHGHSALPDTPWFSPGKVKSSTMQGSCHMQIPPAIPKAMQPASVTVLYLHMGVSHPLLTRIRPATNYFHQGDCRINILIFHITKSSLGCTKTYILPSPQFFCASEFSKYSQFKEGILEWNPRQEPNSALEKSGFIEIF